MPAIDLPYNWSVRDDQKPLWNYMMNRLKKQLEELRLTGKITTQGARAVEVTHRQWGKDTVGMHFICVAAHRRKGNYWHMLPKYEQCRTAMWEAINPDTGILRVDEAFPKQLRSSTNNTEMKIDLLCGSSYRLVGSDNFHKLVGAMPIGIWASEWARANPLAWAYLGPMIEKNGGWAAFVSTSFGRNHLKTLIDFAKNNYEWFGEICKATDSGIFTNKQLESIKSGYSALFGEEMGKALFMQEYFCSFEGAVLGSYYSKQMAAAREDKRIGNVPYQPSQEVSTYWDLGVDDSTSIWFIQHIGQSHHVIDYYENTGMGMEHYANVLKEKKYNYASHVMPHDGDARQMSGGELAKSPRELAIDSGLSPVEIVQRAQNMDLIVKVHIPAVRNMISQCWFDERKCSPGISALENYHAEYNEEKKVLSNRPDHDSNSHACLQGDSLVLLKGKYFKKIKDIEIGELVWTPRGYSRVLNSGPTGCFEKIFKIELKDGRELVCTERHKIFTQKGIVRADALRYNHCILDGGEISCVLISWISTVLGLGFREIITEKIVGLKKDRATFIERFGNFIKVKFQRGSKYTIETAIHLTTIFPTWKLNLLENIKENMQKKGLNSENLSLHPNGHCSLRQNGTKPTKVMSGTKNTQLNAGKSENGINVFALNVAKVLCRLILRGLSFATPIAKVSTVDGSGKLMYDLTIQNHACYLANGMLVSNSDAFRTFAVGYMPKKTVNKNKVYDLIDRRH